MLCHKMSNCYFYYFHNSHKALPQDEQGLVVDEAITGRSHPKSASHQLLSLPQLPQGETSTQVVHCTQAPINTSTTVLSVKCSSTLVLHFKQLCYPAT